MGDELQKYHPSTNDLEDPISQLQATPNLSKGLVLVTITLSHEKYIAQGRNLDNVHP